MAGPWAVTNELLIITLYISASFIGILFFLGLINSLENHVSEVYRLKQIVPHLKTEQFHQQAAFQRINKNHSCIVTMACLGGKNREIKKRILAIFLNSFLLKIFC